MSMDIPTVESRKVMRYYALGKSYSRKLDAAKAIAKKEMAVYVSEYAIAHFKEDIGTQPRFQQDEKYRRNDWRYACAYLLDSWQRVPNSSYVFDFESFERYDDSGGDFDDHPHFGHDSYYKAWVDSRAKQILNGSPVTIKRDRTLWTKEERQLHDAHQVVELMGADVLLTDAGQLILKACDKVADYLEKDPSKQKQEGGN